MQSEKFERFFPTEEPPEEVVQELKVFSQRVETLFANWQSLVRGKPIISLSFDRTNGPPISVSNFEYDLFRLKGLYLDFRPFVAQKEPCNFNRVCNKITRYFRQSRVSEAIDLVKHQWSNKEDFPLEAWHQFSRSEIVDAYFNGELFHSDRSKQEALSRIRDTLPDETLHAILFLDIHVNVRILRNLRLFLLGIFQDPIFVQIPKQL